MKLFCIFLFSSMLVGCGDDLDLSSCASDVTCEVLLMVNQERSNAGVGETKWHEALAVAAQLHAEDMVAQNYFSHDSLDGRNFSQRALAEGYDAFPSGENIAMGQQEAEGVMNSWMQSSGHRQNILNERNNEIGVGFSQGRWVQVFGNR